jgi:hypoxanthine phosphoribosyltransferase
MNKLKITQREVTGLVGKICRELATGTWRPDYIVGITRGGLIPAVMISQYFNIPLHTLNVSLRDADIGPESNLWMAEDALGPLSKDRAVDNDTTFKNILVVDDINDQGTTLNWIMQDWSSGCFPDDPAWEEVWNNNVKFAVLVDNLASKCNVKMDFVGMEVNKAENDVWIDFPWEDWWTK